MHTQGELGNVGEPRVSLSHARTGGPGDQKPWRGLGASPRARARMGKHERTEAGEGLGSERQTSTSSAAGIAGVTAQQYAEHLDENWRDVHERLRSGRYQAAPVERVWRAKDDGGQRPIGKPTFEDKMVQRAVAMLLEAIDEHDFYDGSYGFRPGRSPHDALHELRERCMRDNIGWIVDADVSGYFDSIDRTRLREGLRQRGNDGRIGRLIGKWLRAGGWEEGVLNHPETGV